jgi:hypothetical protein
MECSNTIQVEILELVVLHPYRQKSLSLVYNIKLQVPCQLIHVVKPSSMINIHVINCNYMLDALENGLIALKNHNKILLQSP